MRREARKNQNKIIRTRIKFKSELTDLCLIILFSGHQRPIILFFACTPFIFVLRASQLALRARKKRPATKWLPALNFYVVEIVVNGPRASKL